MKKNWKTRLTAGFLAVLLGCSALLSVPTDTAYAAASQSQEDPQAEDLTIEKGEAFDIASDFTGIHTEEGDKVSYVASADEDGKAFDADRPGTYDCIYRVEKSTGETYICPLCLPPLPRQGKVQPWYRASGSGIPVILDPTAHVISMSMTGWHTVLNRT